MQVKGPRVAVLGLAGAVLVLAALVFAPGWPVYAAIVVGGVTGCAAASVRR